MSFSIGDHSLATDSLHGAFARNWKFWDRRHLKVVKHTKDANQQRG